MICRLLASNAAVGSSAMIRTGFSEIASAIMMRCSMLETAGATIVGRVSLTTVWADSARETFRSTYSGQFAGYLSGSASNDTNAVLGQGLATALTTR